MILESLTLKNFGLYRGEHVLNLLPSRRNGRARPIILIGGINGGGKTTLFDAVQLALYGSRGKYSKPNNVPYDEFLRESIHRGVPHSEGAAIALRFRISSAGEQHSYEVRRVWSQRGQTLRERLYVLKDDEVDQALAAHWVDLVEEVIPLGVSQLFFFDAEKIRLFADDDTGDEALGAAIKSLLGLDLAERLIADASVLETRLTHELRKPEEDTELAALIVALEAKQDEIRPKKEDRASLENRRLRAEKKLRQVRKEFERTGGEYWNQRGERERKLGELQTHELELKAQLIRHATGALPLALVPDLLAAAVVHDEQEHQAHDAMLVHETLIKRDVQMIRKLRQRGLEDDAIEVVHELQKTDRDNRKAVCKPELCLALSQSAHHSLSHLLDDELPRLSDEVRCLLDDLGNVIRERESLQRTLKQTPEDAEISEVVERLNEAAKSTAVLEDRASRLAEDIKTLIFQQSELQREIQKRRRASVEDEIETEDSARMAQLAIRTQATMREYLNRATTDKIDRLSGFVTDSFRYLLRKRTLVEQVQIDPSSFAITLYDSTGNAIPKQRLSEGEKQIFAISVLWGLAQASPRPLPAMIDTPMARLDSKHRNHLIERYFPNASHQVIILSTDTEVDESFYEALEPHIARAYHLSYHEKNKLTVPEEGYFWQENGAALAGKNS